MQISEGKLQDGTRDGKLVTISASTGGLIGYSWSQTLSTHSSFEN